MDANSVSLILGLICEGVGVASKLTDLARRVRAGDIITDAEIIAARQSVTEAVDQWNKAGEEK